MILYCHMLTGIKSTNKYVYCFKDVNVNVTKAKI